LAFFKHFWQFWNFGISKQKENKQNFGELYSATSPMVLSGNKSFRLG